MPQVGVLGAMHTGTAFDEALGLALWAAFGVAFRVTCGTGFEAAVGGSLAGWSPLVEHLGLNETPALGRPIHPGYHSTRSPTLAEASSRNACCVL